jgi:hypothetical protein
MCIVSMPADGRPLRIRFDWVTASRPQFQLRHNLLPRIAMGRVELRNLERRVGSLAMPNQSWSLAKSAVMCCM